MKSVFPTSGSVVFFNGFMNTVVGTHGKWVKIKNQKGKPVTTIGYFGGWGKGTLNKPYKS